MTISDECNPDFIIMVAAGFSLRFSPSNCKSSIIPVYIWIRPLTSHPDGPVGRVNHPASKQMHARCRVD